MADDFILAERIAADSVAVADLVLCHVRLMDDSRYPWLLLLPRRAGLEEWTALNAADLAQLSLEIAQTGAALQTIAVFDKLNVASLGNIVRQMHVHVVGRTIGDESWPDPIWGRGARIPYAPAERDRLVGLLGASLA
ncbi:HIT family protein [Kaistia algarum]|uniref:HIT domain-containing protein n=1 Tax=Kaistia algarum TaxID=2083279 RepID=UPI000CE75621|nr:HIT domain-containing protein [Kaistia algarum]MCX5516158.1 HIT domain-containing protein [Kaistia algarum]PPE78232.1 HIT family protein [Kaistia algarum]